MAPTFSRLASSSSAMDLFGKPLFKPSVDINTVTTSEASEGPASGYAAASGALASDGHPPVAAPEALFIMNVHSLSGDTFQMTVNAAWQGWELMATFGRRLAPVVPGMYTAIVNGSMIDLEKTLGEQGLADGDDVTPVFEASTANDVQTISRAYSDGKAQTMTKKDLLIFNSLGQSMEKVALPSGLKSLTFGGNFNQSMELRRSRCHVACRA